MAEPPSDDRTLSPEDLKRLGLAGHGDLGILRRIGEDLSAFRRALRPSWRGLFGTILFCSLFSWLGRDLGLSLTTFSSWPGEGEAEQASFATALGSMLIERIEAPWLEFARLTYTQWNYASSGMHPLLVLVAGLLLIRSANGRPMKTLVGAACIATGAVAGFLPLAGGSPPEYMSILPADILCTLAGATMVVWLGHRATGLASPKVPYAANAAALAAAALVSFNLVLVTTFLIQSFALSWNMESWSGALGDSEIAFHEAIGPITEYSVPILAGLLFLVPGLIVLRGHSFRSALRTLLRIVTRRTGAFAATVVGLCALALLSPGSILRLALIHLGWVDWLNVNIPESLVLAGCHGIEFGLRIYAVALAATALNDSLPGDD